MLLGTIVEDHLLGQTAPFNRVKMTYFNTDQP